MGCSVKTVVGSGNNKLNKTKTTVYQNGSGSAYYNANSLFSEITPLYVGIEKVVASDTVRDQVAYTVEVTDFNISLNISSGFSSKLEVTIFALY